MFATERFVYDSRINTDHNFVSVSSVSNQTVLLIYENELVYRYVANLNEGLQNICQLYPEKDLFVCPYCCVI